MSTMIGKGTAFFGFGRDEPKNSHSFLTQKELDPDAILANVNNRRYQFPYRTYIPFRGIFMQMDPIELAIRLLDIEFLSADPGSEASLVETEDQLKLSPLRALKSIDLVHLPLVGSRYYPVQQQGRLSSIALDREIKPPDVFGTILDFDVVARPNRGFQVDDNLLNLYSYVSSRPTTMTDPFGLAPWTHIVNCPCAGGTAWCIAGGVTGTWLPYDGFDKSNMAKHLMCVGLTIHKMIKNCKAGNLAGFSKNCEMLKDCYALYW